MKSSVRATKALLNTASASVRQAPTAVETGPSSSDRFSETGVPACLSAWRAGTPAPPFSENASRLTLEDDGTGGFLGEQVAIEAASSMLHLVDVEDWQHKLCGLSLAQVLTGGYCEHLDGSFDDPQFERAIFARDGLEAESCETCLSRHPAVLAVTAEGWR